MEKPKRRTVTSPGIGGLNDSGLRPRLTLPSAPPTSGVREHVDQPVLDEAAPPFFADVPMDRAEKISTRRPRTSRPPVRVDDVGDAAVALASAAARAVPATGPKLLKTRSELAGAPIDHRDAFVLSLLDGRTSTQGVVDLSGLPATDVFAILDRLADLGIISLA